MAGATSDDFLSGHGVPVELHHVETELTRLWGPAAEQVGGPELEHPNVTRIVLANLVVVHRSADGGTLQEVLDTVSARYPTRTIVVCRTDEPGRGLRAEVSALCHMPAPGMPQVCSERIILRAGPESVDLLPGAIRPLLEAELPFVLWWTEDPRKDEALFRDLGDECTRLILDLPDPAADPEAIRLGLDPEVCPHGRDTAWFGLGRWRELVAQFFDAACRLEDLGRIDSVSIEAIAPASEVPPRQAVWLAAWLAGQLGWTQVGRPEHSGGGLKAIFRGPSGDIALNIQTAADASLAVAQLATVTLTTRAVEGRKAEFFRLSRATKDAPEVRVESDSTASCSLTRAVVARELDPARRVSAALESSRNDPPFQKALPHALWLLGVEAKG